MEEWTEEQLDEKLNKDERTVIFFHTPLCGTCQLAKKMLTVVEAIIPDLTIGMSNLNYMPAKASLLEIESVPCLIEYGNGEVKQKLYAFHSVEYVMERLS